MGETDTSHTGHRDAHMDTNQNHHHSSHLALTRPHSRSHAHARTPATPSAPANSIVNQKRTIRIDVAPTWTANQTLLFCRGRASLATCTSPNQRSIIPHQRAASRRGQRCVRSWVLVALPSCPVVMRSSSLVTWRRSRAGGNESRALEEARRPSPRAFATWGQRRSRDERRASDEHACRRRPRSPSQGRRMVRA